MQLGPHPYQNSRMSCWQQYSSRFKHGRVRHEALFVVTSLVRQARWRRSRSQDEPARCPCLELSDRGQLEREQMLFLDQQGIMNKNLVRY